MLASGAFSNPHDFEAQLKQMEELDDPLSVFQSYLAHLESTSAPSSIVINVLERATQAFVEDHRYRNDPRYLQIWLAYARHCKQPEDVFAFLAHNGIAGDLAAYYEEYAAFLEAQLGHWERAEKVLRMGVQRGARPKERLGKKWQDFQTRWARHVASSEDRTADFSRHVRQAWNNEINRTKITLPWTGMAGHSANVIFEKKANEIHGYDSSLVNAAEGESTFEEARALNWKSKSTNGNFLKRPLKAATRIDNSVENADDSDLDDIPLSFPVNPGDLTHISVYRDSTVDLCELAKSIPVRTARSRTDTKENMDIRSTMPIYKSAVLPLVDDVPAIKLEDPFVNHHMSPSQSPTRLRKDFSTLSLMPAEHNSDLAKDPLKGTPVLLGDPHSETFKAEQLSSVIIGQLENTHVIREKAVSKVKAFKQCLGRDGTGANQTVSSLKLPSGHFYMERQLGNNIFLAVDLSADIAGSDTNQVVIKIQDVPSIWEIAVARKLPRKALEYKDNSARFFLPIKSASLYDDVGFLVMEYYEQGTMEDLLNVYSKSSKPIDTLLLIYYARELLDSILRLHRCGVVHGSISPENILLQSEAANLSSRFKSDGSQGWSSKGIILCDFSSAIDMDLVKGENEPMDRGRFTMSTLTAKEAELAPFEIDWIALYSVISKLSATATTGKQPHHDLLESTLGLLNGFRPKYYAQARAALEAQVGRLGQHLEEHHGMPSLKSLLARQEIMILEYHRTRAISQ